jgi:2-aminoadipate transaminase
MSQQISQEPTTSTVARLARRMSGMAASAVREILKVAERPDILSFAGGLPAPELFPVSAIAAALEDVLRRDGAAALQYSVTEGFGPLREWVAARLRRQGASVQADDVLITCGAQQGIDLTAKVLLDPGDRVAVECPSYLAALQCFGGYEAQFVPIGSDDDGLQVEDLERALAAGEHPKLVYVVTEFHNPKGTTLCAERRRRLLALARAHGFAILEDNPYGELRFRGQAPLSLLAESDGATVISLGTFSKTLAPGLRLGWMVAPAQVRLAATVAKQAADLHSATLNQRAAARLLETFDYDGHLGRIRAAYGERCDAMRQALARHLPSGTTWTDPDGGLFLWVKLPGGLRADDLFAEALEEKVAFVPGSPFFPAMARRYEFLRLNFSNRPPSLIDEGMARLGKVIRRHLS